MRYVRIKRTLVGWKPTVLSLIPISHWGEYRESDPINKVHNLIYIAMFTHMELRRIELRSHACKARVLPLYDNPKKTILLLCFLFSNPALLPKTIFSGAQSRKRYAVLSINSSFTISRRNSLNINYWYHNNIIYQLVYKCIVYGVWRIRTFVMALGLQSAPHMLDHCTKTPYTK